MNEKTSMNERKETQTTQESSQKISIYSQLRNTFIFVCRSFSKKLAHLLAGSARDCVSLLQKKRKKQQFLHLLVCWAAVRELERQQQKQKRIKPNEPQHIASVLLSRPLNSVVERQQVLFRDFFSLFYTCFSLSPTHLEDFSTIILKSHTLWKRGKAENFENFVWFKVKLGKSLKSQNKEKKSKVVMMK